ncbi:Peptide chain release factor 1 (RF-1) [Durusdinium trenchii]|uniref:Peptide chain release factor 1 (RF-1) n=1 Tax=Durusdinium trenchii TaxID=1381693 RepID=A0ABP0JQS6_9DINO
MWLHRKVPRRWLCSRCFASWHAVLLDLVQQVPADFAPSGRAAPVLESVRKWQQLQVQLLELQQQKDYESQTAKQAEELEELMSLYDSEIEASDARLVSYGGMLEQELLLFQQDLLRGHRLENLEAAEANSRDAVLELFPGVGGQEAALFTGELLEMYERFADLRGWQFEVESMTEGQPEGAVNFASVRISGSHEENAPFGWLRHESGVHRVQRIPVTEKKGRMQTSSVSVVLLPVAEEADVSLAPGDVRVEISKKSSGPGGQSVNAAHQELWSFSGPSS